MHFFYIDEAGCTGEDLTNLEQPIFVSGGIVVRDEGWNRTKEVFSALISDYFGDQIPANFELHSHELLSPNGAGPFQGHDRARRIKLANDALNLLHERSHHTCYFAIDKAKLGNQLQTQLRSKTYLPRRAPYTVAYDYLISTYEWYTKERLGRSARGMVIADQKDGYDGDIATITQFRRYESPAVQRTKWLTEFTYAVDSHKNPMVQLSDLVCFVTKKFLELESGYRDNWPPAAKTAYRDLYKVAHDRLVRKEPLTEAGRHSDEYNNFIAVIGAWPSRNFARKKYQ